MAREIVIATDAGVTLNSPIAGQTTIVLSSLTYNVGTDELLILYNGSGLVIGLDYTEPNSTTAILTFLPDDILPDVDTFEFITISVGSSLFVPIPTVFTQHDPPKRPNNFNGRFSFP